MSEVSIEEEVVETLAEALPAALLESALMILEEHPRERPPQLEKARVKIQEALEVLSSE